ncbi:hypothetical protein Bbelb_365240 [Branchiostoma belcheri]|nr:hypothetical protein Bbelb_365240 [Branchiostoma belcheri]
MGAKINSDNVIILGDFNTPGIKWDTTVADNSQAYTGQAEKLLNLMDNHGLFQTVQEPTRNGNLLDLVLVNNPNIIEKTTVVPGISDHDMVLVDVNLALKQNRKPKRKVYIRTKADEPAIKKDLKDYATNFHKRTQDMSVTQKWSDFKDKMKDTMNKHIPSKITSSRYNLPWFNRNLRRHCRKKQRLYNKAKKTGQEEDWNKYKRVKKGVQKSIRQAHSKYVADILGEAIVDKPKTFWSYIKGLRKDLVGVAPLKVGNTIISDSGKKAEVLSSQFKSVFTEEDTTDMPSLGQPCTPPMEHIVVSTDGVEKMLQGLNPSKASGPDQIPPWFLKLTASEIAPVLTNIFQHSLNTAEIPKDWRDANICAIFKKGDRAVPSNYRPVSLTCISCKLLEHIIHSQIMKHLESYSILTDYQHGFRAKRSTETQLILTVHDIAGALNSKRQVDLAILDFTKAFDKVPHGRLISKLEYYGIQGPTLNWLKAFLTNREQTVVVEGKASAPVKVASGVPQGTVLGPLLFLLYINDLPDQLDSNVRLFADDCLLYVELSTQTDSQLLQKDLNTLEEWQSKWLMQFNPEKCYIMHITNKRTPHATSYQFCGQALATTKIHPYLGVTLTSGLNRLEPKNRKDRRHPVANLAARPSATSDNVNKHPHKRPLLTLGGQTLSVVKQARLLGIQIQSDLGWDSQVDSMVSKGSKRLFFLCRLRRAGLPPDDLCAIYCGYVRPLLEYAVPVWNAALNIRKVNRLERVQKRACRIMLDRHYTTYVDALQTQSLQTLSDRRHDLCLNFATKIRQSSRFRSWLPSTKGQLQEDVITHCYPLERISATALVLLAMDSAPRDCTGPEPVSNIKPRRTAPLPHDRDPHGFTEKPIQSNRRKNLPGLRKRSVPEVNIQLNCGHQKADHTGPPQSPG